MPVTTTTPKALQPYKFHGLVWEEGSSGEAVTDCPWCNKTAKFFINSESGLWQCKVCQLGTKKGGGSVHTFLQLLWDQSERTTALDQLEELAADRGLLSPETLSAWGVVKSAITREWLVPGYSPEGKLIQLSRYVKSVTTGKRILLATPTLPQGMYGVNLYDPSKPNLDILEGPWDAMVWWEALRSTKRTDDGGYTFTASEINSLFGSTNVVAVPGCGTFNDGWSQLAAGKNVRMLYDNDHPREANGRTIDPPSYTGMKRVATLFSCAPEQPKLVEYLRWGENGTLHNPELPAGYDVRDALKIGATARDRVPEVGGVLSLVQPIPADWVAGRGIAALAGTTELDPLDCRDWQQLRNAWRVPLVWSPGLNKALAVMLACAASTNTIGHAQLWVKVMGPPSCGKTTLCEGLAVAKSYVKSLSTIRGFHSGHSEGKGSENKSLVLKLNGKTLIVKDADPLLTAPNKDQILGEARDLYDKTCRSDYRNGMGMDHANIDMTFIMCGTAALRALDATELGARFLDCVIMEGIDDDMEDDVSWRSINDEVNTLKGGRIKSVGGTDEANARAKRLTGGYVEFLRRNIDDMLASIDMEDRYKRMCMKYGKLVAVLRSRPSTKQTEEVQREFSARLVRQFGRLAMCLTAVLGKRAVDEEVMTYTRSMALDTSRGRTMEICRALLRFQDQGVETKSVGMITNHDEVEETKLLKHLKRIEAITSFQPNIGPGVRGQLRWKLSEKFFQLYSDVVGGA